MSSLQKDLSAYEDALKNVQQEIACRRKDNLELEDSVQLLRTQVSSMSVQREKEEKEELKNMEYAQQREQDLEQQVQNLNLEVVRQQQVLEDAQNAFELHFLQLDQDMNRHQQLLQKTITAAAMQQHLQQHQQHEQIMADEIQQLKSQIMVPEAKTTATATPARRLGGQPSWDIGHESHECDSGTNRADETRATGNGSNSIGCNTTGCHTGMLAGGLRISNAHGGPRTPAKIPMSPRSEAPRSEGRWQELRNIQSGVLL